MRTLKVQDRIMCSRQLPMSSVSTTSSVSPWEGVMKERNLLVTIPRNSRSTEYNESNITGRQGKRGTEAAEVWIEFFISLDIATNRRDNTTG